MRVDGFTEGEAEKFVSNFFTDTNKIVQILKFRPSDSGEGFLYRCPILLSILCFLIKENEVNFLDTNVAIGDLYLQMVQCLYRKFTIRKGTQYEGGEFVKIMKSIGKLALQTLIANNPSMQKKKIFRIVGDSAFEYGFFSGHEHFSTDPTTDLFATCGHRSIEEFFGSLGFIQPFDDRKSVDDIMGSDCKEPIFMVNPLVLRFCFWFLTTNYFKFSKKIYHQLASCAAKVIDCHTFDTWTIRDAFPAIDIGNPSNNRSVLKFLEELFKKCKGIRLLDIDLLFS